jgi:hypothetical protein
MSPNIPRPAQKDTQAIFRPQEKVGWVYTSVICDVWLHTCLLGDIYVILRFDFNFILDNVLCTIFFYICCVYSRFWFIRSGIMLPIVTRKSA